MRSFAATAAVWVEELRVLVAARMLAIKGLLRRSLEDEARHLFLLTLVVGLVCGLVAVSFHVAIQAAEGLLIQRALHAPGDTWMFWTILSPTIGGLCAGAALTWLTPGARGSGIPQVKRAFAIEGGRVRFRDAVGKFIIASLQIGSGASLGREGPTVQICARATSLLTHLQGSPQSSALHHAMHPLHQPPKLTSIVMSAPATDGIDPNLEQATLAELNEALSLAFKEIASRGGMLRPGE